MKYRFVLLVVVVAALVLINQTSFAQCAMCQATAESSLDAGASTAEGINKGIMYLFFMPWIVLATVSYFWWRANKKAQQ